MTKFNVGDKVIGLSSADTYGITKESWIGKVLEVSPGEKYMQVTAVDGTPGKHEVECKHFELLQIAPIKPKTPMKNLEAAARALKRKGPKQEYRITVAFTKVIEAIDEDDAKEIIQNGINVDNCMPDLGSTLQIIKVINNSI